MLKNTVSLDVAVGLSIQLPRRFLRTLWVRVLSHTLSSKNQPEVVHDLGHL